MVTFKKRYREHNTLQEGLKWIADIIVVVCFVYMIAVNLFSETTVIGHSMESYLYNGDKVLIDKMSYEVSAPERYDIVLFHNDNPEAALEYSVKRIIGLPGESIRIEDGMVYIDGAPLKDDKGGQVIYDAGIAKTEIILGEHEYFVLGDNRNNSEDSRQSTVGLVEREDIIGMVWLIYSPIERFEFVK